MPIYVRHGSFGPYVTKMEKERGKNKSAAVKRRIKSYSSKLDATISQPEGGKRWAFIAAGVLILTIVAFLSGLRLGKSLHDLKYGEIISSPAKIANDIEKKEIPYKWEKPKTEKSPEALSMPPSPPMPVPKPKSSPPKAKYTLQVAALNNAEEAKQMVLQLQNKGYAAYQISGSGAAKGTLYRVRIGHFASLQEAKEFALNFEKKEKIKPLIKPIAEE